MSPRKKAKTQHADKLVLMSDFGQLPACRTDEYRDQVKSARLKFDRLDAFSCEELEALVTDERSAISIGKRNEMSGLGPWIVGREARSP